MVTFTVERTLKASAVLWSLQIRESSALDFRAKRAIDFRKRSSNLWFFAVIVQLQFSVWLVSQNALHLVLQDVAVNEALQLLYLLRAGASSLR